MNPDTNAYRNATEEHDRGAVLVAVVIDGFLRSYHDAIADLLRIATAGTGVRPPGRTASPIWSNVSHRQRLRPPSATRRSASGPSTTCRPWISYASSSPTSIYSPPTPCTYAYLIEGFRARGIYPASVVSLADGSWASTATMGATPPNPFRPLYQQRAAYDKRSGHLSHHKT